MKKTLLVSSLLLFLLPQVLGYVDLRVASINTQITDSNIFVGTQIPFTTKIFNDGNENTSNALISVFHGAILPSTLVYETRKSFDANSFQDINFNYTPQNTGSDTIIVFIDKNSEISESDENNNVLQKDFPVYPPNYFLPFTAYIQEMAFSATNPNCIVRLSNGDKIIFHSIDANKMAMSFTQTDFFGNIVVDVNEGKANQQWNIGYASIRLIQLSEQSANLLYVFSSPIAIEKNDCVINTNQLLFDLKMCESNKEQLKQEKDNALNEKAVAEMISEERQKHIESLQTSLSSTTTAKNDCESKMISFSGECDNKILVQKQLDENTLQTRQNIAEGEKSLLKEDIANVWNWAFAGWALFLVVAISWIIWHKYQIGGM